MKTLIFAALALVSLNVSAWDGNTYYSDGGLLNRTIQGLNTNTGSQWTTTINKSGAYGYDKNGDFWKYDRGTGIYSGNGVICAGSGIFRRCSQ